MVEKTFVILYNDEKGYGILHAEKAVSSFRMQARFSQKAVFSLFHVGQQAVQKREKGETIPERLKIIQIAKHFGVFWDAFIFVIPILCSFDINEVRIP